MITLRKSEERGQSAHGGWLESAHSFSFGDYFDIRHQGHDLRGGDGTLLDGETELILEDSTDAEVLVFDLVRD